VVELGDQTQFHELYHLDDPMQMVVVALVEDTAVHNETVEENVESIMPKKTIK